MIVLNIKQNFSVNLENRIISILQNIALSAYQINLYIILSSQEQYNIMMND
ncbi:hypothetical protein pb186bvf_002765 [Paramecium bursaria]